MLIGTVTSAATRESEPDHGVLLGVRLARPRVTAEFGAGTLALLLSLLTAAFVPGVGQAASIRADQEVKSRL